MNKITAWLHEAGDWHRRNENFTGFTHISLHYRMWKEGFAGKREPGHKVLCLDQPMRLRKMDMAVNHLSKRQRECVQLKFFSPLSPDGHPFTNRDMARAKGMSMYAFVQNVKRGRQKITTFLSKKGL